ncbi:MAG TPA: S9 family peptidase, partial [Bacteroidota bacterium]|nr:S9 family peptidase [Bacteroidota bacterium]
MKTVTGLLLAGALTFTPAAGQTTYKLPPKEVVDILDAPPTPGVIVSPARNAMMLVDYQPNPSLEFIAQPILRIAGIRISPALSARQRITQYTGLRIKHFASKKEITVALPKKSNIGIPVWSFDGTKAAFTRDLKNGVELWVVDARTGKAHALPGIHVNDVIDVPFEWMSDNRTLLVRSIAPSRGKTPKPPLVPAGPNVEETFGKVSKTATYQDLLKSPFDEVLFEYYATTQLALVNSSTGKSTPLGTPGMYMSAEFSPDERFVLVTKLEHPFSYRVPYDDFARSVDVWDRKGTLVKTIAKFPVTDEIPTQGVQTGPRNVMWQPLVDAKLVWV